MADGADDFVVVVNRKKAKRFNPKSNRGKKKSLNDFKFTDDDIVLDKLAPKIETVKSKLTGSEWLEKLFETVEKSAELLGWRDGSDIEDVFCYGLGNVALSQRVRYQFAVLLLLRDRYDCNIKVYDPLFYPQEIEFIESLGVEVLKENEEGKRKIDRPALIYFPHCVRQLTNNFLYANWGPGLKNCVLFSNSFAKVLEQWKQPDNTAEYIGRINPYTREFKLADCFEHLHSFYDSVIHVFPPEKLKAVPDGFWEDRKEPNYTDPEAELIVNPNSCRAMNPNLKILRSLISEIRHIARDKNMKDNAMVRYVLEESRKHRETSEVLCKAREELKFLGETYRDYLASQRRYNEIRKHYAGRGERTIRETADLVGFKLPHDPK